MKTSSPIASPAGTTATRPVCRRLGFELRDPGWRPSPKARGDWPLAQVILSFVFGVLLLAATLAVEVSTGMCAETFFDPLPSVRHALLVIDPLPVRVDARSRRWGCFLATRRAERLAVCESIRDEAGQSWTDVSAWYWAAALSQSRGPWWAVTVVEAAPWRESPMPDYSI